MIFKRRKYPLPRFPHNVVKEFRSRCELLPDERVREFIPEVQKVVEHFREISPQFPYLDVQRVEAMGKVCIELLQAYDSSPASHKKLIVGAVRYFASTEDPVSETAFASGLDDDVRVLNHVAEEIGRADLYMECY